MADVLNAADIEKSLKGMDGWGHDDVYNCIRKEFSFDSFVSATTFVQHVASIASEMTHYPDILIHGGSKVKITTTTQEAGGVTENDVAFIESLEILVNS
tara:strand:- start:107 stop:403 length:297 start_codon:yes stop_codon:yes gene_type:complete